MESLKEISKTSNKQRGASYLLCGIWNFKSAYFVTADYNNNNVIMVAVLNKMRLLTKPQQIVHIGC